MTGRKQTRKNSSKIVVVIETMIGRQFILFVSISVILLLSTNIALARPVTQEGEAGAHNGRGSAMPSSCCIDVFSNNNLY